MYPAELISPSLIVCTINASEVVGSLLFRISLNAGAEGSFSTSLGFTSFGECIVQSIEPSVGPSEGGSLVRISGSGFSVPPLMPWCRIGGVLGVVLNSTDTLLLCTAPYGTEGVGSAVEVSLDGSNWCGDSAVLFSYYGQRRPELAGAFFTSTGDALVITFDAPGGTNRGGMNGRGPCSCVLSNDTVVLLQGTASEGGG